MAACLRWSVGSLELIPIRYLAVWIQAVSIPSVVHAPQRGRFMQRRLAILVPRNKLVGIRVPELCFLLYSLPQSQPSVHPGSRRLRRAAERQCIRLDLVDAAIYPTYEERGNREKLLRTGGDEIRQIRSKCNNCVLSRLSMLAMGVQILMVVMSPLKQATLITPQLPY